MLTIGRGHHTTTRKSRSGPTRRILQKTSTTGETGPRPGTATGDDPATTEVDHRNVDRHTTMTAVPHPGITSRPTTIVARVHAADQHHVTDLAADHATPRTRASLTAKYVTSGICLASM